MKTDSQPPVWKRQPNELDFEQLDRWFKGEFCHRFPVDRDLLPEDVLLGWMPQDRVITHDSRVIAFGSCFAEHFIRFLSAHGYNNWTTPSEQYSPSEENLLLALGQTFENIFVVVQQFRWAFGEFAPKPGLWITKDKVCFDATEERRRKLLEALSAADVVVITLGLSEVWFDQVENEPLWRTMPENLYEPDRHRFRLAAVSETEEALLVLDRILQQHCPRLKVILTLSPIPLLATFRNQSAVTANHVSKAILRVALDAFFSRVDILSSGRYHYFPSYELAFSLFGNPFEADNRHVRPEVAGAILEIFRDRYTDIPGSSEAWKKHVQGDEGARSQVRALEQELKKKEAVIQDLSRAAEERLEIIRKLERSAQS